MKKILGILVAVCVIAVAAPAMACWWCGGGSSYGYSYVDGWQDQFVAHGTVGYQNYASAGLLFNQDSQLWGTTWMGTYDANLFQVMGYDVAHAGSTGAGFGIATFSGSGVTNVDVSGLLIGNSEAFADNYYTTDAYAGSMMNSGGGEMFSGVHQLGESYVSTGYCGLAYAQGFAAQSHDVAYVHIMGGSDVWGVQTGQGSISTFASN